MLNLPLVSCVVPSAPGRDTFFPLAEELIKRQRQIYPNIEIIHEIGSPTGFNRNQVCEKASGKIIAHWDDDDWYSVCRIFKQVKLLLDGIKICGTSTYYSYDLLTGVGVEKAEMDGPTYSTLVYWKELWEKHPFDNSRRMGECTEFINHYKSDIVDMKDMGLTVYLRHNINTTGKCPIYGRNKIFATKQVQEMMGPDLFRFTEIAEKLT